MKEYIVKEEILEHIHQRILAGNYQEPEDIYSDVDNFSTITDLDISKLVAVRFIDIVNSIGKQLGVELDNTTVIEIFNIIFSEMEQE